MHMHIEMKVMSLSESDAMGGEALHGTQEFNTTSKERSG
jgi:hypothetical protein